MALPPIERGQAEIVPFVVPAQVAEAPRPSAGLSDSSQSHVAIEERVQASAGVGGGRLCADRSSHGREHEEQGSSGSA